MTIKEKINKFISEKKITHAEIGRGLNTSQQNVSRILGESGKRHTLKYVHVVSSEVLDDIDLVTY